MEYEFENYYYTQHEDVPFQQIVSVTVATISRWCTHFAALITSPKSKDIAPREREGQLPEDVGQREAFVKEILEWIFVNSDIEHHFYLDLYDGSDDDPMRACKFMYADDGGMWLLYLTEDEFAELQDVWEANGLPRDLFFPSDEWRYVPHSGKGLMDRLLRGIGIPKRYTPRQWAAEIDQVDEPG